ncbi:2-hydroxychromene-2-carboxylate isomerase [Paroceanicella profunda]|uniref:2-hydroxychromene-2-carboxylate isomerase n=1 Tax=Paroceanicella profunda TaxID=2579971 RepID=A0A5B8FXN0_9RHOB|nr:2-hydroxychromene-2-carboxylate isomerase [Paroceanicella profunda]QDL91990.1 2-hydroxychromene-2-carboxylate isomerase [Paroceanicella profunda]
MTTIDYFMVTVSPYTYLAGLELEALAARHGAEIVYRPFAIGKVFEATGTPLPPQRHPSRQSYRLKDIARSAAAAGLPINVKPRHWPVNPVPSCAAVIAAQEAGSPNVGALAHALLAACWAEERDIADEAEVKACMSAFDVDPALLDRRLLASVETFERNTALALEKGVFGAPTYVVGEEVFWGHDRLGHLEAHLAAL